MADELTKKAASKAYKAGYALPGVDWAPVLDVTTPEQRALGVHHCPFAEGDPQRDEWLKGLRDRLADEQPVDPAAVIETIDQELS